MTKPTGKPRGRPPVEERRANLIQALTTDAEKAALYDVATDMGVTLTDALRSLPRVWAALTERQRERLRNAH